MSKNIGPVYNGITQAGNIQTLKSVSNLLINSNSLAQLDDCSIITPTNKQSVIYNSSNSKWENTNLLFASSLQDVVITAPQAQDRLVYSTGTGWINQQPYFFSATVTCKLKDSYIQSLGGTTGPVVNLLVNNSLVYDSYTISNISSSGLIYDSINGTLSNFRTSANYSWEQSLNFSILTCANNSYFYYGIRHTTSVAGSGDSAVFSYNSLNNPSKTLSTCLMQGLNNTLLYYPFFNMSSSNAYTGNTNGDLVVSIAIYEL